MIFFHTPMLLGLVLIPLFFFLRMGYKQTDPFAGIISQEMQEKLFLKASLLSTATRYNLFLLTIFLFIVALARPVMVLPSTKVSQIKPAVLLAVDVSHSMSKRDVYPSRLQLAKAKLLTFIQHADTFNIAVVYFAQDAYLLYPLSQDTQILKTLLKESNITQKFKPNTNLFAALEAGQILLKNHKNKHIVLFGDGGTDIPRVQEQSMLQSQHITLSTLATTPTIQTNIQRLCQKTQGKYQHFTYSDEDITAIIAHIKQVTHGAETYHYETPSYQEYFPYPLALALGILALHFLPLRFTAIALLCATLSPPPLHAELLDFWHTHRAIKATKAHNYPSAIQHYKQMALTPTRAYNLAYILYQSARYHDAISTYQKALGVSTRRDAKVYYNIATAYAHQNKLDFAKEYYEKSLLLYPDKHTQENLIIVKKALKAQRRNLHKKYQKLHFKPVAENAFSQKNAFSHYAIKLHTFLPTQEQKWFQKIAAHASATYLQKIITKKRSLDANISE